MTGWKRSHLVLEHKKPAIPKGDILTAAHFAKVSGNKESYHRIMTEVDIVTVVDEILLKMMEV